MVLTIWPDSSYPDRLRLIPPRFLVPRCVSVQAGASSESRGGPQQAADPGLSGVQGNVRHNCSHLAGRPRLAGSIGARKPAFGPRAVTGICARLGTWGELCPDPSAPAEQNGAVRGHEDERLAKSAGVDVLDRDQVIHLVGWKFQSMARRKALAMRGISPQRWAGPDGAAELTRHALADNRLAAIPERLPKAGQALRPGLREVDRALWVAADDLSLA